MIKIKFLAIFLIFFQFALQVQSNNNILLLFKVNNIIVTNIDIENEKKYLIALNQELIKLREEQLITIAKDSIIREHIKKTELIKYYKLGQKNESINQIVSDYYKKIGFKNDFEFEVYLKKYDLKINDIKKKFEIEKTWNSHIYNKFKNRIFIDEKKLTKKISNKETENKSYLLSEIIFKNKKKELQKQQLRIIIESINEIGFGNTANIYSVADSKKFAGNIGWIEEKFLSESLNLILKKLMPGEYSLPINVGANSLILKIEDIKINKVKINPKEELQRLVNFETNKQLDKFSLIYFNRIKLDATINEY
tara:strand:- start:387 stop:1313 length:927 start_codon:yes stop_codon:yes gene_type:complete